MTLAQWKNAYKTPCSADGLSIHSADVSKEALRNLFHLEDYYVSTALSGPSYRLCLRVGPPLVDLAYYPEDWQ